MFQSSAKGNTVGMLAFPVPELPPTVRKATPAFAFPFPASATREDGTRAPWNVPAWLPRAAEGPATFLVGALAGCLLAAGAFAIMDACFPTPAQAETATHAIATGARVLVIAKPLTAAVRAPIAPVEVDPSVATPAVPARFERTANRTKRGTR